MAAVTPVRIQRRRTKGYRLPPDAIYVGRPSRWGNPHRIGAPDYPWCMQTVSFAAERIVAGPLDAGAARYHFRLTAVDRLTREPDWLAPLRGRDLACWCPLDQPCHADVLLELANA
jgi:hypothetical protein